MHSAQCIIISHMDALCHLYVTLHIVTFFSLRVLALHIVIIVTEWTITHMDAHSHLCDTVHIVIIVTNCLYRIWMHSVTCVTLYT